MEGGARLSGRWHVSYFDRLRAAGWLLDLAAVCLLRDSGYAVSE
jgi:hypothetical protein